LFRKLSEQGSLNRTWYEPGMAEVTSCLCHDIYMCVFCEFLKHDRYEGYESISYL